MGDLMQLCQGLGPEIKAAIVGAIGTLAAAILGGGALVLQMRSQGRQSRDAIAENERRKLKAAMYEDAVVTSRALAEAAIALSAALRNTKMQVKLAASAAERGHQFQVPDVRFPALANQYVRFSEAALRLIFLIEHRRFIDPRLLIFRTAVNVVLHDANHIMFSRFVVTVIPALPIEGPDGLLPYTPPYLAVAQEIERLCDDFIRSLDDIVSYTEDFLVELQNRLLGDLFGTSVSHRQPIDPDSKVITLDRAEELEAWFAASTAWGRNMVRLESDARKHFGQANSK
jgi:hypothetical protein